jgi:hypothetical protein
MSENFFNLQRTAIELMAQHCAIDKDFPGYRSCQRHILTDQKRWFPWLAKSVQEFRYRNKRV